MHPKPAFRLILGALTEVPSERVRLAPQAKFSCVKLLVAWNPLGGFAIQEGRGCATQANNFTSILGPSRRRCRPRGVHCTSRYRRYNVNHEIAGRDRGFITNTKVGRSRVCSVCLLLEALSAAMPTEGVWLCTSSANMFLPGTL